LLDAAVEFGVRATPVDVPSLHWSAIALGCLFAATSLAALPALVGGFRRRGTGRVYENRFWIQRAPQIAVAVNVCSLYFDRPMDRSFSIVHFLPMPVATLVAWSGVMLAAYGALLLLRGWYALGENLSVDAELLHHQNLCTSGPYKVVMHPVYAGIVHTLLGAALALLSPVSAAITIGLVTPLFARRARYEEGLLTAAFGSAYTEYGEHMGWHRFVPTFLSSAKR
jgi:protein-S-isoprenylcysteine O-methyltransferase Ste14